MKTVTVKATWDRDTKNTHRYPIDENDQGVSGIIYIRKDGSPRADKLEVVVAKEEK